MAENNQLSDETKNNSTDTSSTDASSAVIGNHENAIVPHKISNHDKLVQTMVMVDGEWINVNDTNDQANTKEDMHKVNKKVVEAQKGIVEAKNTADSAVKYADSAVSASKVNSDAIVAQSSAISEAKAAADDAASKAQFIKENASSEAAAIRNQVADVANNVSSVKADVASATSDVANLKVDVQANSAAIIKTNEAVSIQSKSSSDAINELKIANGQVESIAKDAKNNAVFATQTATSATVEATNASSAATKAELSVNGLTTRVTAIEGDNKKLSNQIASTETILQQTKDQLLQKADKSIVDQANNLISQLSAEQKIMAGQIEQKASSTELDNALTSINKNTTAIDENSKAIKLKANQTEVDNVKNTASRNSSRIDVMANEIQSKVTSTDVNNIVDSKGYATTSTVQSLITQKAGTINESITNLTNEMNTRNGVNLLKGTKDFSGSWHNYGSTNCWHTENWIDPNGNHSVKSDSLSWYGYYQPTYLDTGDYTFSGYYYSEGGKPVFCYIRPNSGDNLIEVSYNSNLDSTPNGWRWFVVHFKVTKAGNAAVRLESGQNQILHIASYKLERGTVANPVWTPAPSDNATVTQIQSITASIDGVQSNVTNLKNGTSSKITQLSNTIQSKVSSSDFNSKITQLANDINLRVTKGDLLSQINIAAGRTLIQSNKIYFDADSFVMSPNSTAFIPSAYITDINADKITTGTLDAAKFNVKNLSADSITSGTLDGIKFKTEFTNDNGISIMGDRIAWTSMTSFGEQLNGWIENSTQEIDWLSFRDLRLQSANNIAVDTKGTNDVTRWSIADYDYYDQPGLMSSNNHKFIPEEHRHDESADADQSNAVLLASANTYVAVRRRTGVVVHLDSKFFNEDSTFAIQKDNKVGFYVGQGENGNQVNVQLVGDGSGFNVRGNFNVYGAKNSAVKTSQGDVAVSAYETAEYYFGDIGEGQTDSNGVAYIGIEKLFNETVNTNIPYQVFITAYGPGNVWVEQRKQDRFMVKSSQPNIKFGWEIKAKRRGYENTRLQKVN